MSFIELFQVTLLIDYKRTPCWVSGYEWRTGETKFYKFVRNRLNDYLVEMLKNQSKKML